MRFPITHSPSPQTNITKKGRKHPCMNKEYTSFALPLLDKNSPVYSDSEYSALKYIPCKLLWSVEKEHVPTCKTRT